MTDGAARLLMRHMSSTSSVTLNDYPRPEMDQAAREVEMQRRVFKAAYSRLISRDPKTRWTSGQWMTERPGGSDVSRTETRAVYSPLSPGQNYTGEIGPWAVNGYKFFSSATDSNMAVLLARTEGHKSLSAFFAPMRLPSGDPNGVRIVRLKKKMGTKALPTAELELRGMRAWMIGKEGEGVREMTTVLNVTRVHNSITAASFMRRALAVAKVRGVLLPRRDHGIDLNRLTPASVSSPAGVNCLPSPCMSAHCRRWNFSREHAHTSPSFQPIC